MRLSPRGNIHGEGGRFIFGDGPEPGDLFLRHDVDLSLHAAVQMAELEAELGAKTTYLLMTESVFYNLASPEGDVAIARLRQLGHAVGLHAVYPNVTLDERSGRILAFCAIDNLWKGASGQAVQNLNLMLGLDELEGLTW